MAEPSERSSARKSNEFSRRAASKWKRWVDAWPGCRRDCCASKHWASEWRKWRGSTKANSASTKPPAVGGPESDVDVSPVGCRSSCSRPDMLAGQIRAREDELEVLASLLANQKFRQEVALAGRPIKLGWMSSGFGRRVDPITGRMAWHAGADFAGKPGSDIVAVASGVVTFAGERSGYGRMIEINHGGGYITPIRTS